MTETKTNFITVNEAKIGFKNMMKVIRRILSDAELCKKNGRVSSVVSLSILALEEISKADFFRRKIKENKTITENEWKKLTAGGSHETKLNWPLDKKAEKLEKWSYVDFQALNEVNQKLGIDLHYMNKEGMKEDIELFRKIVPKFNKIKQECFYTNWSPKNRTWSYFDKRFSDKIKKLISDFLYYEAKKDFANLQFAIELPNKKFKDYTDSDWAKIKESKSCKELQKTVSDLNNVLSGDFSLFVSTISNYD